MGRGGGIPHLPQKERGAGVNNSDTPNTHFHQPNRTRHNLDALVESSWYAISQRLLDEAVSLWDLEGEGEFERWITEEFWGRWEELEMLN